MARKKGKKYNPWTSADEDILIKNIRKDTNNLTKAFKQTSVEIQRSPGACSSHWYNNTSVKSGHVLFLRIDGTRIVVNRSRGKGSPTTVPLYKKVLSLFGLSY